MSQNGVLRSKRPQLSESIEKLDAMIDGLAGAIPGAVAESVREVLATILPEIVKAAVDRAAAELAVTLAARVPAPAAAPRSVAESSPATRRVWAGRLGERLRSLVGAVRSRAGKVWSSARVLLGVVASLVRASPRAAAGAALVGTAVGAGGYHLGPTVVAVVAGLAAGLLALAGVWLAPFARLLAPTQDA